MQRNSNLKIDRAIKFIDELDLLIQTKRPFIYTLETNIKTGERSTYAKRNEFVINQIALTCGDLIHNLRAALDHAYWDIVSPFSTTEKEKKNIQFPFSKKAEELEQTIKSRIPNGVPSSFLAAMLDLKPHGEAGGNNVLYLVHELDIVDKHKHLIPTVNNTNITSDIIRKQVPDFPIEMVDCSIGGSRRDVVWNVNPSQISKETLGNIIAPTLILFEKELDLLVDVCLPTNSGMDPHHYPIVSTLKNLIKVCTDAIEVMEKAV